MKVLKVAEQSVADKLDTQYIADYFADMPNIAVVFVCTADDGEEDDWTDEAGLRHLVIHLPLQTVSVLDDARPLMLATLQERLGLST